MTEAVRKLFQTSKDWVSLTTQLNPLSDIEKGDAFETIVKHFLCTSPIYTTRLKHVWLLNEVPERTRKRLNLPNRDQGIDIVAETFEGEYWAIQCKYRSDTRSSLTFREVSTFVALAFGRCNNIAYGLICVTGERYTKVLKGQSRVGFCANDVWISLGSDFFTSLNSRISGTLHRAKPLLLRPHQMAAVEQVVQYFSSPSNFCGKLVMPCGTGKSLIGCRVARDLNAKNILVAVPSLSLLNQTIKVWSQNYAATESGELPWICVCSDETVGDIQRDEIISTRSDLEFPCTTDAASIVEWFDKTKNATSRIVFTTYQSGKVIGAASRKAQVDYDFGIFDEAHKTTGNADALFSYLLHERNVKIKKRLFMTATERRYEGNKGSIASMDDVSLYGETAHHLSFKEALSSWPRIIADYKILTLFVSRAEIAEIISRNTFVRPVHMLQTKWDDEVEANMLACLVALRKAMKQFHVSHTVSYHASIARAKAFQLNADIFTESYPNYGVLYQS
jgi:predicted helicase